MDTILSDLLPVSCYIRTLNEERFIGGVITAAQQICNDVVIVDCGSSDKTAQIAKDLGAKVIDQPWLGNGSQKRVGEDAAVNDWVLDIDADEVVSPELANEIRQVFKSTPSAETLFSLNVATAPPIGKPWLTYGGARRVKLYNKTFIRIPDHKAWDQFDIPKGVKTVALKQALVHYSFADIAHLLRKQNRVSTVRATQTKLKPLAYVRLRVWFGFPFYFLRNYIRRGMFRAGTYGFVVAITGAQGRWLKDVKMYEIHRFRKEKQNSGR